MAIPLLTARVEQSDSLIGQRINCCLLRALMRVAEQARPAEIVAVRHTACGFRQDMVYLISTI